jgi:ubiquinol-cytochrome c reductase cytochrome b subunit
VNAPIDRLLAAIDERSGLVTAWRRISNLPVTTGALPRIALSAALFGVLALVVTSGVALDLHYSPSTTHAWASVLYIENTLPLGHVTRALHVQGTNALLVGLALQLLVAVAQGTTRRPRELIWWLSLATLALVLGEAMTGALLPWDEQGYWASRVEVGIIGTTPLFGDFLGRFAQGGNDFGHLMLTRYHALHAVVLPALVVLVVGLQLRMLSRLGPAPSTGRQRSLFPVGTFAMLAGLICGLAVTAALALKLGTLLEGPADPSGGFPPRPAWYFRALYELRRRFEGPLEPVATMVIPGLLGALMVAVPFIDRADRPSRRRVLALLGAVLIAAMGLATLSGHRRDASDATYAAMLVKSSQRRDKAVSLAKAGVPPEGPLFMLRNTPEARGKKLFSERCAGCHAGAEPLEKPKGPDLAGWAGKEWLARCIAHPEAPTFFGATKIAGMDAYESLGEAKLSLLAAFLAGLKAHAGTSPDTLPKELHDGRDLFDAEGCASCHSLVPGEAGAAPNLSGYASDSWISGLLMRPGHELFFGEDNEMPSYEGKLDERQVADLTRYLRELELLPPRAPTLANTAPAEGAHD